MCRYPKSERNRIRNFFPILIPILFLIPNFSIPNPKPSKKWKSFETEKFRNRNITQNTQNMNQTESKTFSDTKFLDTESDTFFNTKFLRYRNQYFFQNQKFSIPNPKLPKKRKFFETEKFRNRNVTLWYHRHLISS